MRVVPWSQISSWRCNNCGICCRCYDVVLKFPEWLGIVKNFGVEYTAPNITKFYLRRSADGSCMFLYRTPKISFCTLQHMKPKACKLWPFKVSNRPTFSNPNKAVYHYNDQKFFVYADATCAGLRFGTPTQEFIYSVVPEFVEIALGIREKQYKTTSSKRV